MDISEEPLEGQSSISSATRMHSLKSQAAELKTKYYVSVNLPEHKAAYETKTDVEPLFKHLQNPPAKSMTEMMPGRLGSETPGAAGGDDLSARASLLVQKHTAEPAQWRLPAGLKWPRLARLYNCTLLCATSCVVLGLVVINLANSLVLGLPYPWLCLSPDTVFEYWELHRFLTALPFHQSLFHLLVHLMLFVPLASFTERNVGTVRFAHMLLVYALVPAALTVFLGFLLSSPTLFGGITTDMERFRCSMGISGMLFAMVAFYTLDDAESCSPDLTALVGVVGHAVTGSPWAQVAHSFYEVLTFPPPWIVWSLALFIAVWWPGDTLQYLCGAFVGAVFATGPRSYIRLEPHTVRYLERQVRYLYSLPPQMLYVAEYVAYPPGFRLDPTANVAMGNTDPEDDLESSWTPSSLRDTIATNRASGIAKLQEPLGVFTSGHDLQATLGGSANQHQPSRPPYVSQIRELEHKIRDTSKFLHILETTEPAVKLNRGTQRFEHVVHS
mmetsp:Transcript_19779/g.37736  ORF Transcript_19779/g.37736 Transcript_19779/m.37736 type:complete len:500 (+) Transcript_19779:295-1794(+)|eukprot:CAMPEP_0114241098 /NCGR_PEP_ID=MMETSP0058-20121206/9456_1 /TAXON_ID=36894 /ORGANISM="Pyramimonas parkeae, CCMP726" /LENGTH=499 /DNA_ID=CAMNT_0001353611 /DNA_START=216 /DNA_END=1715 /DNA_ORIENTATION=+